MIALKITVILVCLLIAYQDFKERAVSWVLFPLVGILMAFLYVRVTTLSQYALFVSVNLLLVSGILLILFLYTKHIARKQFLNVSFGLGDVLFFYAFALGFPSPTFVVLFAVSIVFSLVIFLIPIKGKQFTTIPLAGLMGCFLIAIFLTSFLPQTPSLYSF